MRCRPCTNNQARLEKARPEVRLFPNSAQNRTPPDFREVPEPDVRAPFVTARVWVPPIVIKAGYIRREAQHGTRGGSRQGGHSRRTDQASGGCCGQSDCGSILAHGPDDKQSGCDSIPVRAQVQ